MPRRLFLFFLLSAPALLAGCGDDPAPTAGDASPPVAATTPQEPGPLAQKLKAKSDAGLKMMPPEVVAVFKKAGEELAASNLAAQAKTVGAQAPVFSLKDGAGASTALAELLKEGPVVLTFYRGEW